jgi:hypothetical protein
MALGTIGTNSTTSLQAARFNATGATTTGNTLSAADLASIAESIVGDRYFAASGFIGTTGAIGVLVTASTHSNTTLDTLVSTAGGPLASIQIGALVLGVGIPLGTFVIAKPSGTSVTLSQAATTTANTVRMGIINPRPASGLSFEGFLEIPGRGRLIVRPNDIVAVDNTGWPLLVSGTSAGYAGSQWHLVGIT